MWKPPQILLALATAAAPLLGQSLQTLVTPLTVQGTTSIIQSTGGPLRQANFTATGTATVDAQLGRSGTFTASGSTGTVSGDLKGTDMVTGSFTINLGSGNTLTGTLSLPLAFVFPQVGASQGKTGTATITGGTGTLGVPGSLQGASGSFPVIAGSATATGADTSSFTLSSSGTVTLPLTNLGLGITTNTTSTSRTQTLHNTNATAEVNNYATRLTARIGTGSLLYDQSFNAPVTDAAVQAAIQQARTQLTTAGAKSISGPNQLTNSRVLSGTSPTTTVNSTTTAQEVMVELTIGPGTAITGDRGLCEGITTIPGITDGVLNRRVVFGCPGGTPYTILNNNSNINTNINTQSDIFQTVTTISTFLTSQTYELNGTAAPSPPATPAPPSFWLALTGGAATGLSALAKRFRNRKES